MKPKFSDILDTAAAGMIRVISGCDADKNGITNATEASLIVEIENDGDQFAVVAVPKNGDDAAVVKIMIKRDVIALENDEFVRSRKYADIFFAEDESEDAKIPNSASELIKLARSLLSPTRRTTTLGTPTSFAVAYDILSGNLFRERYDDANLYRIRCAWPLNEECSWAEVDHPEEDPRIPLLRMAKPRFAETHANLNGSFILLPRKISSFLDELPTAASATAHERMAAIALLREVAELAKDDPLIRHPAWKTALGQT